MLWRLVSAPSIPDFERQFVAGEFDFAYMNPYHMIVSHQSQGYIPLARDVGRRLYGILVVHKDSPVTEIKDLDGKIVAFPAPNSVGASLMPRAEFARKYLITVRPRYVNSHDSVYLNVALGQADAGGGVQKTLEQQPESVKKLLRVLHKTVEIPPHPIVVHPRVPGKVQTLVKESFLALGDSETGQTLLQKVPIRKIGEASLGDYKVLEDMGLDEFFVKE